jgi:hypothetical protein
VHLWVGGTVTSNLIGSGAVVVISVWDGSATIEFNTFEGNCHARGVDLVHLETEADHLLFRQNTCYYPSLLGLAPGATGKIVNNVFLDTDIVCNIGATLEMIDYNLWRVAPHVFGTCADLLGPNNLLDVDPLFCAEESCSDYSLNAASPCVGAGEHGETIGAWPVGCGVVSVPDATAARPSLRLLSAAGTLPLRVGISATLDGLSLFDVSGRRVGRLPVASGISEISWSPPVAPGVYFLRGDESGPALEVPIVK